MEKIVKSVFVLLNRLSNRLYIFGVGAFFCIFFLTMANIVKYPSTIVSSTNWTNYTVAQIGSDNTAYAYTTQITSQPAVSRNYDFNTLPDDAVIEGIVVEVQISSNNATRIAYMKVRYSVDGVSNWSAYKPEQSQTGTADSTKTFGANNDLWGLTPTAAQIKNTTNFRIDTAGRSNNASYRCRVDFVRVTVYYHRAINQGLTESISATEITEIKESKKLVESVGLSSSLANILDLSLSDNQESVEGLNSLLEAKRLLSDTVGMSEKTHRKSLRIINTKVRLLIEEESEQYGKSLGLNITYGNH